jgi:hypothetical protein
LRLRPEYTQNHRYFNNLLNEDRNFGASHRARIGVDVQPADFIAARFTFQDARTWGSPTLFLQREDFGRTLDPWGNTLAPPEDQDRNSALRIHEAFLDLSVGENFIKARLGRQEWNFGAGRQIGNDDWNQRARSFDGFDISFSHEKLIKADLLFAWIDERNALAGDDMLFGGIYASSPYFEDMPIEAYFLYLSDDRAGAKRNVGTVGGRVSGKFPAHQAFFFDVEGAMQFGTVTEQHVNDAVTKDNPHYAVMAHIDAGYDLPVPTDPAVGLFFDLVSGDGNTSPTEAANDQSAGWIPLFPTMHGQFGKLDIFNPKNIWDMGVMARLSPLKELTVTAEVHSLHMYDGRGAIPQGGNSSNSYLDELDSGLGTEINLEAKYSLHENLEFMAGYGVFLPGATFSDLDARDELILEDEETGESFRYPRGDPAHWVYLQADLTF